MDVELTDEQRKAYIEHVRSLDRVEGKPGSAKPDAPAPADGAKPYVDPVAEKAAEYLRRKLKEA